MKLKRETTLRLQRTLRHIRPSHIVKTRMTRGIIENFAEKVGLVYFGFVDQRDDDHRLIRGHTVSKTHQDNHYCIGTVRGYDVMLVLRNDVVRLPSGKEARCHWLIYTIDLHTKFDVPHCYVGHTSRSNVFAAAYRPLHPLAIGGLGMYPHAFSSNYTIYGAATNTYAIERIIDPQVAEVIVSHFQNVSVEIEGSTLYLYVEAERPNAQQLEKMLSNGLWLAEVIDSRLGVTKNETE